MKVLFFGTPEIAVPYLEWLSLNAMVVGVVTKPDEPVGRGYKLTAPAVKVVAEQKGLRVLQPEGPWDAQKIEDLKVDTPDVGVVVAYGRLMPRSVFTAPRLGSFNIHFSLLPSYRGAAPLQWSLINGDLKTGVTAFWIEEGMDSGPICQAASLPIDPDDNALTLKKKLIPLGVHVMDRVLSDLSHGKIVREPQQGEASLAPQLKKEDGRIDWSKPAAGIQNLIRGVYEWPGAFTQYAPPGGASRQLKIFKARGISIGISGAEPGTIVEVKKNEGFVVQTGPGQLLLLEVQPEGKKRLPAGAFWLGARLKIGDKLG